MCQNQNADVRPEKQHFSWKAFHCAFFLLSILLHFPSRRGMEVSAATSLSLLLACASPQAPSVGRGDAEAVLWTRFKAETQIGAFPALLCQSHWLNKEPQETYPGCICCGTSTFFCVPCHLFIQAAIRGSFFHSSTKKQSVYPSTHWDTFSSCNLETPYLKLWLAQKVLTVPIKARRQNFQHGMHERSYWSSFYCEYWV